MNSWHKKMPWWKLLFEIMNSFYFLFYVYGGSTNFGDLFRSTTTCHLVQNWSYFTLNGSLIQSSIHNNFSLTRGGMSFITLGTLFFLPEFHQKIVCFYNLYSLSSVMLATIGSMRIRIRLNFFVYLCKITVF